MAEKPGRPPVYQSKDEKPATVSLRIPRDLYDQAQKYVKQRSPMTLTDLLLDGLRLRLETPADPRDLILSDDNTVIQEVQEMIRAAVQAEVGRVSAFMQPHSPTPRVTPPPEAAAEPVPEISHDDNTVLQETEGTAPADAPEAVAAQIDQHITRLEDRIHEMQSRNGESTDTVPDIAYDDNTVLQENAVALKQCKNGHAHYPGSKSECPTCVRKRKQRSRKAKRQRQPD